MTPEAAQLGSTVKRELVGDGSVLRTVHGHELPANGVRRTRLRIGQPKGAACLRIGQVVDDAFGSDR